MTTTDVPVLEALVRMNFEQIAEFRLTCVEIGRGAYADIPNIASIFCALSNVGFDEALSVVVTAMARCDALELEGFVSLIRRCALRGSKRPVVELFRAIANLAREVQTGTPITTIPEGETYDYRARNRSNRPNRRGLAQVPRTSGRSPRAGTPRRRN